MNQLPNIKIRGEKKFGRNSVLGSKDPDKVHLVRKTEDRAAVKRVGPGQEGSWKDCGKGTCTRKAEKRGPLGGGGPRVPYKKRKSEKHTRRCRIWTRLHQEKFTGEWRNRGSWTSGFALGKNRHHLFTKDIALPPFVQNPKR